MNTSVSRWPPLALAVFALVALVSFLGSRGLNEPDEGRYAEIGREMAASGEWLVPHLNGIPHFQKPPLLYWATAASLRVFGVNEWAARLPSALAALGTVALTYWIGTLLFGRATGIAAALVLVSSGGFFVAARLLTPDMMMTFWITAALAFLVKYARHGGRGWAWLFFAAMGLGFMTKGPMAFVVPIAAALVWRRSLRRSPTPLRLPWAGGIVLMLAIALSWFVLLSLRDHELFRYFAGDELVQRFASKHHGRSKPFWFFLWVLPAALFPWTFFLGALLASTVQRWRAGWRPGPEAQLLAGWIAIPLVVLSLSGSKLPTYVLPLFPALALAIGHWTRNAANQRPWNLALLLTVGALVVIAIAMPVLRASLRWPLPNVYLLWPLLAAAVFLARRHPVSTRAVLSAGAVAVWLSAAERMEILNDHLEQQASVKPLAERLRLAPDLERATIFACEVRAHGWEFYLGRLTHMTRADADVVLPLTAEQQDRMIANPNSCGADMLRRAPAYGLVRADRYRRSFAQEQWRVLEREGDFLLIASRDSALGRR